MKNIIFAATAILATLCSCSKDDTSSAFGVDTSALEVAATGTTASVKVSGDKSWTASTQETWILVSPANGTAGTECKIRVDSTLLDVKRTGTVTFSVLGETKTLTINQAGYPKQILVGDEQTEVEIPCYDDPENLYFDVDVMSNVLFDVVLPEDATWLTYDEYSQNLNAKYRPRKTTIRFRWNINTRPNTKSALVSFAPKSASDVIEDANLSKVKVMQEAAQKIEFGRSGDSLALISIAKNIKQWSDSYDTSKPMDDWSDVVLWNKKAAAERAAESNGTIKADTLVGRVRYVRFFLFDTKVTLPYEVQFLSAAEEIIFYGNTNNQTRAIELGTEITTLKHLKKLTIDAYGLTSLPAEMTNMTDLEELELNSNNFISLPSILTPENFPKLHKLSICSQRKRDIYDLSNTTYKPEELGWCGEFPEALLRWDNLETLELTNNFFEGSIPAMSSYTAYTAEEAAAAGNAALTGTPKVLPRCTRFTINFNFLTGELPQWILLHPHLEDWSPYTFVYSQYGKNSNGQNSGFTNVPD